MEKKIEIISNEINTLNDLLANCRNILTTKMTEAERCALKNRVRELHGQLTAYENCYELLSEHEYSA